MQCILHRMSLRAKRLVIGIHQVLDELNNLIPLVLVDLCPIKGASISAIALVTLPGILVFIQLKITKGNLGERSDSAPGTPKQTTGVLPGCTALLTSFSRRL